MKSDPGKQVAQLGEVLSLAAGCNDMPPICIDWYWTTFDPNTGEVVGEIFLYSSCYDPCSFGSSGSGGSSNNNNCNEINAQLASGPVSSTLQSSLQNQQANERTVLYSWEFQRQSMGLWSYRSQEKGVHEKQPNGTWKWKSLTHLSVSRTGWTLGANINCIVDYATATVGIYHAGIQLRYSIVASAICAGFQIEFSNIFVSNGPIWHVDYQPGAAI